MDVNSRLQEAIGNKDVRKAKGALAKGADPNLRFGSEDRSALCHAVAAGSTELVRLLLEAGARVAAEKGRTTSIHLAAAQGQVEILQLMLHADGRKALGRFNTDGCTPLMCAVEAGRIEAVRVLLEAGADVNAEDPQTGNTALRHAAADGSLEMVRLLVEAGADPLIPGRMTLTALDRAQERKTPEGRLITACLKKAVEERAQRQVSRKARQKSAAPSSRPAGRR